MIKNILRWLFPGGQPAGEKAPDEPSFVRYPYFHTHRDNSTKELPWSHPKGHPYQVYEGPHHPYPLNAPTEQQRQVWTNTTSLPGYAIVHCYFTDRPYLVWKGKD